ncbi:MAG: hypothetical protein Q4D58_09905 [Synergistaceae bacterium]|nr:hypothetical protein [Synergistaceae bacterium]
MAQEIVYHCDRCGRAINAGEYVFSFVVGKYGISSSGKTCWVGEKRLELCARCAGPVIEIMGGGFAEDGPLRAVETGHLDSATLNRTSKSFAGVSSFSSRPEARQLNDSDQTASRG